jgi:class 3 adenylate cyclase
MRLTGPKDGATGFDYGPRAAARETRPPSGSAHHTRRHYNWFTEGFDTADLKDAKVANAYCRCARLLRCSFDNHCTRQDDAGEKVGVERKLTAILCADVYGYSRLMGGDEEATLVTLTAHRKIIDSLIEQHHGRFVNSPGDSVLAEFASVVNAVECAIEIQTTLKAENAKLPPERQMEFRIGVNLGDVMVEGDQIYGDGINVAARLESLANPGGICISGMVHEQVRDKLALGYEDNGEQTVKNIARPVHVWRVLLNGTTAHRETRRIPRRYWRGGVLSLSGLAIMVGTIVLVQHVSIKPPRTHASNAPQEKPALSLPSIPSIAVLPFAELSGDPKQGYFSDGITDALINDLSRIPGLFVIDRNSSFSYKGKAATAKEVSGELGVHYLLEGSTLKAGNQVGHHCAVGRCHRRCDPVDTTLRPTPSGHPFAAG